MIHSYSTGESLIDIAISYGISVNDLYQANGLSENSIIFPSQKLIIPQDTKPVSKSPKATQHLVLPGESLLDIATKYSMSVAEIRSINNLTDQAVVFPGTVLSLIPKAEPIITSSSKAPKNCLVHGYHKVKVGDQLNRIAAFHSVSIQALLTANNLSWNSVVAPGSKLVIPIAHGPLNCPSLVELSTTASLVRDKMVNQAEVFGLDDFGQVTALCLEMQRSGLVPELGKTALIDELLLRLVKIDSAELSVQEYLIQAGYPDLAEGASLWEPSAWKWLHQIRTQSE